MAGIFLGRPKKTVTATTKLVGLRKKFSNVHHFISQYITTYRGLHSVPVRQFEVITPEGLRILHTGDNQTSETIPLLADIDVLLLNSWLNESGTTFST